MRHQDWDRARSREEDEEAESGQRSSRSPGKRTLSMSIGHASAAALGTRSPGKRTLAMGLPIQMRLGGASAPLPREDDEPAGASPESSGSGQPLPEALRRKMERLLGADLSAVRIHEGPQAPAMGALAYAQGTDIHFAPGRYDPESQSGQELLGHELAHVVQQAQGRVQPTTQAGSVAINDSSALEREADALGAKAAAAPAREVERAAPDAVPTTASHAPAAAVQASPGGKTLPLQAKGSPSAAEKKKAKALAKELQALIDGAVWKEIRKTVYPKESKAGVKRAKQRKDKKQPDLTGLGKIATLEHFAAAIKKLQAGWGPLSPDERASAVGKAMDDELVAADVPRLKDVKKITTEFKGSFSSRLWRFNISEELVNKSPLGDADAAELCNTGLHEARHAEQAFLAARFAAGPPDNKDAATIHAEHDIPEKPVAEEAVGKKFDAATDPAVVALGKKMYKADVTDRDANQDISDDDYRPEMDAKRKEAQVALDDLNATPSKQTIAKATTKRGELKAAIAEVKRRYTLYRNIPYEADAHEVGDAAEQAFKGWP